MTAHLNPSFRRVASIVYEGQMLPFAKLVSKIDQWSLGLSGSTKPTKLHMKVEDISTKRLPDIERDLEASLFLLQSHETHDQE